MPRYVLVNRRAGKFTDEQKYASRAAVALTLTHLEGSSRVISDKDPVNELARRVVIFDADSSRVASMRASLSPDVCLEPLIRRSLHFETPIELTHALSLTAASPQIAVASPYGINITGAGKPLPGIQVIFYLQDPTGQMRSIKASTDDQGHAGTNVPAGYVISFVEPIPYSDFWIMLSEAPPSGSTLDCLSIPKAGPSGIGWWHTVMGIDAHADDRGKGIRVGIIDTGCGPHPNLAHVNLVGVFVDGQILPPVQATDVAEHGTHTTGIVGARPTRAGDFAGIAPGCDVYHARAFKSEDEGPSQADLINAIDALSRGNACDLINMSLGGGPPSQAEEDAIKDAAERGTLCICSAGNEAGPIDFPGAYPECAAVSAIGQIGWAPPGTFSFGNRPKDPSMIGQTNLFLATFSCFGSTLACAAPGVGIVSTVPDRNGFTNLYMEMDGTSMASPAVCGALAVILSADAHYNSLPRDISRSNAARNLLAQHCLPFGLPIKFEGRGLPQE